MLLDDDVQVGVVVDRRGAYRGLVTVEQIAAFTRDTGREAQAAAAEAAEAADPGDGASDDAPAGGGDEVGAEAAAT
jgi:hypothetical protein